MLPLPPRWRRAWFLDASKAFDRVNHAMLFRKLMVRSRPGCLLRLLHFWYTNQTMMIKWGNCMFDSFNVSNGVRQGSILSPYVFAVCMDDLSSELNKVNMLVALWEISSIIILCMLTIYVAFVLLYQGSMNY